MSVPCKNIDDPGLFQIIKPEPATSPTNNALAAILVPSMNGQWSLSWRLGGFVIMLPHGSRLLYGVEPPKELETTMAGFKYIERYVVLIIIERRPLRALQSRRFARWIPRWREAIDQPPWVGLEEVRLLSIWNLAHSHWNGILPPRPLDFQVNSVTFWFFFVVTATTVVEISNLGTVKWQLL